MKGTDRTDLIEEIDKLINIQFKVNKYNHFNVLTGLYSGAM